MATNRDTFTMASSCKLEVGEQDEAKKKDVQGYKMKPGMQLRYLAKVFWFSVRFFSINQIKIQAYI